MHRYAAYGLAIASELALPELPSSEATGLPDVTVRVGATPERLADPVVERVLWMASADAWLLTVDGVGRFWVRDGGREVTIDRAGGSDADLRAFFLGPTLGALLNQRGRFALHACAVAIGGGAVAVAGPSGAGKSTTVAALVRRGHPLLADDKTLAALGGEAPIVIPGIPALRLWADAVERLGEAPAAHPALREGLSKHVVRAQRFRAEPTPLRAVAVLSPSATPDPPGGVEVVPLPGPAAVRALLRQTYQREAAYAAGFRVAHFRWAAALAAAVPVVRVGRVEGAETVEAVADAVEGIVAEIRG